jgi:uncharacterized protein
LPASPIREFSDATVDPPVRGFLHLPESPTGDALILTHGAGSNAQAPLLVALAEAFSSEGFTVLRCNLPYRQTRSFGPPGPGDAARDRAGLKNAVAAIQKAMGAPPLSRSVRQAGDFDFPAKHAATKSQISERNESKSSGRIFLGGHSYGGRQSSMFCAEWSKEEPTLVAGLLLLSYPLHPPRRPEQQRTQHLPDLRTPTLFVHGTRDPFGSVAEIERALKMIPARTKLIAAEGAGHDLGFKGKAAPQALIATIAAAFHDLFAGGRTETL